MKSGIIKKVIIGVFSLLVLTGIIVYLSGAFRDKIKPGVAEAPRRMKGDRETDVVHKVVQTQQIEIIGTVRAKQRTEVAARIMAAITAMKVKAGDGVSKGQILVELDNRDLKARVEQASQAVVAAKVNRTNAEKTYQRYKKLKELNAASVSEYDNALAGIEGANARLRQAEEALKSAEAMLSYAVIRAPVGGTVVDKSMDVGDITQPGRPILSIYDPSVLWLEAAVPQVMASSLKKNDPIKMTIDTIESTREKPLEGRIEEIVPQADPASRSVMVKVMIPKEVSGVIEGASGRLYIPTQERIRLCVADSAVVRVGQLRYVDVVKPDDVLERRMVKLGEKSPYGRVEILAGLKPGEKVVLYGPPPAPIPEGTRLFSEEGSR